jgi:uncharacterized protein
VKTSSSQSAKSNIVSELNNPLPPLEPKIVVGLTAQAQLDQEPPVLFPPAPINLYAENPPWTGLEVFLMALVLIGALFWFTTISFGIARHYSSHSIRQLAKEPSVLVIVPAMALAYLTVMFFMYLRLTQAHHVKFWQGVSWRWPEGNSWLGFLLGGGVMAITLGLLSRFLPMPKSLPVDRFFADPQSAYLMVLFGVAIAPLAEELLFRGFLYPVLDRWLQNLFTRRQSVPRDAMGAVRPSVISPAAKAGRILAIVITSAGFAMMHSDQLGKAWAPLLVLFVVGCVLTITRAVTKAVAPGVLIHVGYNSTLFGLLYLATDHFRHLERMTQ